MNLSTMNWMPRTTTTQTARPGNPWLAYHRPQEAARIRLFCFPYAGGGASLYRTWAQGLPPQVEVCPVQLPGRENRIREEPFRRMETLVEALAAGLAPLLDRPFAFFGHSMGSLIAFELTRHLVRERGLSPAHLFVSGHRAPQLPPRDEPIHPLPDEEFLAKVFELNGTPEEVRTDPELRALFLPILRADFELCETYGYQEAAPLPCPVSAFGGLGDHHVPREDLQAWQEQSQGRFVLRMLPGDHFFLTSAEPLLLRTLGQELYTIARKQP